MTQFFSRWQVILALVAVGIGLDQVSKAVAIQARLPMYLNQGISFAWFNQQSPLLVTSLVVVLLGAVAWFGRSWWVARPLGAGAFFGGAVSNGIDRLVWGGVRDWLPIPGTTLHNNLADWLISFAVVYLLWTELSLLAASRKGVTHA